MPLRKTHDPSNIDAPQVSNNESTTNIDGSRRKSWGQRSLNLLEWSFTSLASGGSGSCETGSKGGGQSNSMAAAAAAEEVARGFYNRRDSRGSGSRGGHSSSCGRKGGRGSYGDGINDTHLHRSVQDPYAPSSFQEDLDDIFDDSDSSRDGDTTSNCSPSVGSKNSSKASSSSNRDSTRSKSLAKRGLPQGIASKRSGSSLSGAGNLDDDHDEPKHPPWYMSHRVLLVSSIASILVGGSIAIGAKHLGVNDEEQLTNVDMMRESGTPHLQVEYYDVKESNEDNNNYVQSSISSNVHDAPSDLVHYEKVGSAEKQEENRQYSQDPGLQQHLLEIAEQVLLVCSESLLSQDSNGNSYSECKQLCHHHLCCFEKPNFNCNNDETKYCAVYAGCEILMEERGMMVVEDYGKGHVKEGRKIKWG